MKHTIPLLLPMLLFPTLAWAQPVAWVSGKPISREAVIKSNPNASDNAQVFTSSLNALINRTLLVHDAKQANLTKSTTFQNALAAEKTNLIIQYALDNYIKTHPITQQAIQKRYKQLASQAPKHQYRLREIVVATRNTANQLLQQLKSGHGFSALAATKSQGPNAALGGELGWINETQVAAPILERIRTLPVGDVVGPINLPDGWADIQLLGRRKPEIMPLTSAENAIRGQLIQLEKNHYIQSLRKAAKVKLNLDTKGNPA
jgi:peptidyl-prolyl cis-trans isomerase C